MRSLFLLLALLSVPGGVAVAQVGPTTAPSTRPTPATVAIRSPLGAITPADGPVPVPYTLSPTNHLIVRLKINGQGPFNFVVDTGAPTMLLDEGVAKRVGLKLQPSTRPTTAATTRPSGQGWATIDRLDIEGGLSIARVKCLVLTPYQITGMNAVGISGIELHGLLGYSVLARFKMEIDLSRHHMVWTPQPADYVPPPLRTGGHAQSDAREDRLESMGGLMKVLGPLVKSQMPGPPVPRGWIGVELREEPGGSVSVARVFEGSPAALAGLKAGDPIYSVGGQAVHSIAEVESRASRLLPGDKVVMNVGPGKTTRQTTDKTEGDTRTSVTTITTVSRLVTITCGEGL